MPKIPYRSDPMVAPQEGPAVQMTDVSGTLGAMGRMAAAGASDASAYAAQGAKLLSLQELQARKEKEKQLDLEANSSVASYSLFEQQLSNSLLSNKGAAAADNIRTYDEQARKKLEEAVSQVSLPEGQAAVRNMLERSYTARRGVIQTHQDGEYDMLLSNVAEGGMNDLRADSTLDIGVIASNFALAKPHIETYAKLHRLDLESATRAWGRRYAAERITEVLQNKNEAGAKFLLDDKTLAPYIGEAERGRLTSFLQPREEAKKNDADIYAAHEAGRNDGLGDINRSKAQLKLVELVGPTKAHELSGALQTLISATNQPIHGETARAAGALVRDELEVLYKTNGVARPLTEEQMMEIRSQYVDVLADSPELQDKVDKTVTSALRSWNSDATGAVKVRFTDSLTRLNDILADPKLKEDDKRRYASGLIDQNPDEMSHKALYEVLNTAQIQETPQQRAIDQAASMRIGILLTGLNETQKQMIDAVPPTPPEPLRGRAATPEQKAVRQKEWDAYNVARAAWKQNNPGVDHPNVLAIRQLESQMSRRARGVSVAYRTGEADSSPGYQAIDMAVNRVLDAAQIPKTLKGGGDNPEFMQYKSILIEQASVHLQLAGISPDRFDGKADDAFGMLRGMLKAQGFGANAQSLKSVLAATQLKVPEGQPREGKLLLSQPYRLQWDPLFAGLARSDRLLTNVRLSENVRSYLDYAATHSTVQTISWLTNPVNQKLAGQLITEIRMLKARQDDPKDLLQDELHYVPATYTPRFYY